MYNFEGQWALSQDVEEPTSEFKYSFKLPANAQPPMLPSGYVPRNPAIPSTPEDNKVSAPMSGYFNVKGVGGAVTKVKEDRVVLRFGGPVPPEAPTTITESGSHTTEEAPVAASSLIGVTGEGANQVGKFTLEGVYHPPTGNLWCLKVYVQTPLKKKGEDDRAPRASRGPAIPAAMARNLTTEQRICKDIVAEVKRLGGRDAQPFLEPFDAEAHGLKDYNAIITHPMDLRTVETKIVKGEYPAMDDFAADMHLTFDNAIRYNGPEHWAGKAAKKMREIFEERFQDRKERRKRQEEEMRIRAGQAEEAKRRAEAERREEARNREKDRVDSAARRTSTGLSGVKREREEDSGAASAAKKAKKEVMPGMAQMMGASGMVMEGDAAGANMRAMMQMMMAGFAEAMKNPEAFGMAGVPNMAAMAAAGAQQAAATRPAAPAPAPRAAPAKKTAPAASARQSAAAAPARSAFPPSRASSGPSGPPPASRSLNDIHGASIPLTDDEMVELSSSIESLNGDQMQRIAQILKEANYLAPDADLEEVEIDPSTIGTKTLREIKAYADSCLGRGPAFRPGMAAPVRPPVPVPHRPVAAPPPALPHHVAAPPMMPAPVVAPPGYGPLSAYPDDDSDNDVAPPPF